MKPVYVPPAAPDKAARWHMFLQMNDPLYKGAYVHLGRQLRRIPGGKHPYSMPAMVLHCLIQMHRVSSKGGFKYKGYFNNHGQLVVTRAVIKKFYYSLFEEELSDSKITTALTVLEREGYLSRVRIPIKRGYWKIGI